MAANGINLDSLQESQDLQENDFLIVGNLKNKKTTKIKRNKAGLLESPANPQDGDTLVYNSTSGEWEAGASGGNGFNVEVVGITYVESGMRILPVMEDVDITVNGDFYDLTPKEGKEIVSCLSTVIKGSNPNGINQATTRTILNNTTNEGVLKVNASVLGTDSEGLNLITTNEVVINEGHNVFLYVATKDIEEEEQEAQQQEEQEASYTL